MTDRPLSPFDDQAFQRAASLADDAVYNALTAAHSIQQEPAAIVAGAVRALVRYVVATISPPATVRRVVGILIPSINHAATEEVAGSGQAVRSPLIVLPSKRLLDS